MLISFIIRWLLHKRQAEVEMRPARSALAFLEIDKVASDEAESDENLTVTC